MFPTSKTKADSGSKNGEGIEGWQAKKLKKIAINLAAASAI